MKRKKNGNAKHIKKNNQVKFTKINENSTKTI